MRRLAVSTRPAPCPWRSLRAALRPLALLPPLLAAACAPVAPPCAQDRGEPLTLVRLGWAPLVPVALDGRVVPFLLDTGATRTALAAGGAQRLGLTVLEGPSQRSHGIGGVSEAGAARVAGLRFGTAALRDVMLPVIRQTQGSEADPVVQAWYGVVGADLLSRHELELEFAAGRAVLHPASGCAVGPPPWTGPFEAVPAGILSNGLVVLEGAANGRPVRALFDTGAQRSVMFLDAALRSGVADTALAAAPAGMAHGFGTAAVPARAVVLDSLRLGPRLWRQVPVAVVPGGAELPFDMIVGQDFIGGRRFWLSYVRGVLYVQDPREGAKPPPAGSPGGTAQQP